MMSRTRKTQRSTSSSAPKRSHRKPRTSQAGTGRNSASKRRTQGGGTHKRTGARKGRGTNSKSNTYKQRTTKSAGSVRPPEKGTMRIIPIGGCEEVGRNMTIFEYDGDILIHDMGLQFPEEDMPGIDFIIPNIKYLKGREKDVRGVVFSHGHLDHIGAAPILLEQLGYPPIVAMPLTLAMIKHKQDDYKKNTAKRLKTIPVKKITDRIQMGKFNVGFFQVEHSIMDSMGTIINTPAGTVLHPGDWTMERQEDDSTHIKYHHLAKEKGPKVLMLESLGSLKYGRHATHEELYDNLKEVLAKAKGRVIIATFSSQVERVKWVIEAANNLGKKVALDGYSMKNNIEIASKLGYVKPKRGLLIDVHKIDKHKDNEVVVICTGAQGEENAVLNRIASGNHRTIKLRKSDTVVFSSSVIPGNERSIQRLKDNIYRQSDHVIHGDLMDVHVSGHGTRRDIVDMLDQVKPDFYFPVFGNHFFLKEAKTLAMEHGFDEKKIFVPDNGQVFELKDGKIKVLDKKVPSEYVFVDGLGVSDSQHIVLRDRQVLAEDGMVVVIATIHNKTGKLIQNPDIVSRGFVFLKDNKKLIEDIRQKVKSLVLKSDPSTWADTNGIRNDIRDKIGQFIFTKTGKRPMVLPVVIEV